MDRDAILPAPTGGRNTDPSVTRTVPCVGFLELLEKVSPGVREVRRQVPAYREWWEQQNETVLRSIELGGSGSGPLWIALGDSTAQGVGASAPDLGYVGLVLEALRVQEPRWQVVNLSVSGATVRQLLDDHFPRFNEVRRQLEVPTALVTCGIGANDLVPTPMARLVHDLGELVHRLPDGTVVLDLPNAIRPKKAALANVALRDVATSRAGAGGSSGSWSAEARASGGDAVQKGLQVLDLWGHTGGPWRTTRAADRYHPSDAGYRSWATVLAEALDVPLA